MKYKVGDVVEVRKGLCVGKSYGSDSFVDGMKDATTVTIKRVREDSYKVEENEYNYTDEMLDELLFRDIRDEHKARKAPKFKVGDLVRVKECGIEQLNGCLAIVVTHNTSGHHNDIGVDFGKVAKNMTFGSRMTHRLGEVLPEYTGLWVESGNLEVVERDQ